MVEIFTQRDIEKISFDILRESKSLGVFPTPVDRIVQYAELSHDKNLDLSCVDQSFLKTVSSTAIDGFLSTVKKIRGYLDRSEKIIYIDPNQIQSRQSFVKLHETGHEVLYWQHDIMACFDTDETLSYDVREEFEAEANYFASATLFQLDLFDNEMNKLELSLKAGIALAKKFGASNHAAFRRMVERSSKRCALLVLKNHSGVISDGLECHKRDLFLSPKFIEDFGQLDIPDRLDYQWPFTQDYIAGKKFHENGSVELQTDTEKITFNYHYFNNSYNAFVFIIPQGEYQKTKTKIILTNV
jgi:hypothetical protein